MRCNGFLYRVAFAKHTHKLTLLSGPQIVFKFICAEIIGSNDIEGDAQDITRQDAKLVHQVGKAVGQRPSLAGARPGDDADKPLSGGIPAFIIRGNTITLEEYNRWYTPVYLMHRWVRKEPLLFGNGGYKSNELLKRLDEPIHRALKLLLQEPERPKTGFSVG